MDPLLERAGSPAYTPGRRDIEPLLDLLAGVSDEEAVAVRKALCRRPELSGPAAIVRLRTALSGVSGPSEVSGVSGVAGRLLRFLGQLAAAPGADREAIAGALIAALSADDPGVRRRAAVALGKLGPGPGAVEEALLARLPQPDRPDVTRAIVDALGLVGGEAAARTLAALPGAEGDKVQSALLRIRRTLSRPEGSAIDPAVLPRQPVPVRLHCRAGLEELLAEEVAALGLGSGELRGPIAELHAARLWTEIGFPLPPAADAATAITSAEGLAVLRGFTRGTIRYRIAFAGGGHRRAEVRAIARAVAARAPDLINDPTRTDWEAVIDDRGGGPVRVELRPRGLADPRFAYRVADVPAASHPTLAAALARLAWRHAPDPAADVVWDPFCGSGLELIERARLGPARRLIGSDSAAAALDAARANVQSAGVAVDLQAGDALTHAVDGLTTMITNPPMGRRVARGEMVDLLERFVTRAGALLPPGGRLVWIAPSPRRTDPVAAAAGLSPGYRQTVDMGGFSGQLQVLVRGPLG